VWAEHSHPLTGLDERTAEAALAALPGKILEAISVCADVVDFGPNFHRTNEGALAALELLQAARTMVLLDSRQDTGRVVAEARKYKFNQREDLRVKYEGQFDDELQETIDAIRAFLDWVTRAITLTDPGKDKTFHRGLSAVRETPGRWRTLAREAADWLVLTPRICRRIRLALPKNFPEDDHIFDAEARLLDATTDRAFDVADATARVDETKVVSLVARALLHGFGCESGDLKELFAAVTKAAFRANGGI
jgi:hypothetical protein